MDQQLVHFEVFSKRVGSKAFELEFATEDRDYALDEATGLLKNNRFIAALVTKETLNPETGVYKSTTIFNKGRPQRQHSKAPVEDPGASCVRPADLYTVFARNLISRLLEGWLTRNRVTAFELLHRSDLIEKLDTSSGAELLHAIQKVAVPEAQTRNVGVHEVIRNLQQLVQRTLERAREDRRKGIFPDIKDEGFAAVCTRLSDNPEWRYLISGAVASHIAAATSWREKVGMLLDLAEAAPARGQGRSLAFNVLEQPLGEIIQSRAVMADLVGADLDLGSNLGALIRLAAARPVAALAKTDATVARLIPPLPGPAERLAGWLDGPSFENVRQALGQKILQELRTLRRLRPSDARGEIDIMRALAMALAAASGPLLPLEEVREAFIKRSEALVASDFVSAYLSEERSAIQEAHDLIWLLENVTGAANKRTAMRWLISAISSLKFETEMASKAETPAGHLARLAELHRQLTRTNVDVADVKTALQKIGEIGGQVEADAKLVNHLIRSPAPLSQRLRALIRMATGETAPPGPAADRARAEVVHAMRVPETRAALKEAPEMLKQIRAWSSPSEATA